MKTVNEKIEAYNKKAKKWGYKPIVIRKGKVVGEFDEKYLYGSFFHRIKMAYHNGYLKEDFEKIKKELS